MHQSKLHEAYVSLIEEYRKTYKLQHLTPLRVGVLLSGGLDSVGLLDVANDLQIKTNTFITAAHVLFNDFPEKLKTLASVYSLVDRYSIPLHIRNSTESKQDGTNKTTARSELKNSMLHDSFDLIITGHHLDL